MPADVYRIFEEATNLNREKLNTILQLMPRLCLYRRQFVYRSNRAKCENAQTGGKIAQGFNNEFFFQNYSPSFLPEESTSLKRRTRNLLLDVNKQYLISIQNLALDTAYRLR